MGLLTLPIATVRRYIGTTGKFLPYKPLYQLALFGDIWNAFDRLASTTNGYGAATVGVEDPLDKYVGDTVEAVLSELGTRIASALVTVTASAAAESANNIDVTINVVDLAGVAVSRAQKLLCEVLKSDLTDASATEYRLSETGAGSEISTTAKPKLLIATDSSGDATVRVHDQAGASNASVILKITPVAVSGSYTHGLPTYVVLTFDAA